MLARAKIGEGRHCVRSKLGDLDGARGRKDRVEGRVSKM